VYACEWNPNAIGALRHNLLVNGVENRCIVLEGDNRLTAPKVNHSCLRPLVKECAAVNIYEGCIFMILMTLEGSSLGLE
jgi:tRNA G37 N-methylase Trm5